MPFGSERVKCPVCGGYFDPNLSSSPAVCDGCNNNA